MPVRGGGADENLMMLDGTPLYNVSHLFGLLSVFTPEAVKKVTFYKGSFPARYGGRVSSIVDVRTNDGNAKGLHGSVSAGLLSEKLHIEGPIGSENTTFSVSGRGMHTFLFDGLIKALGSPANYAFYDLNAKLAHRFSDSDKVFEGFYTGKDYFRMTDTDVHRKEEEGPDSQSYIREETDNSKVNVRWGNTVASMRWNHVFSSRLFSNTSVSWNNYNMDLQTIEEEIVKSPFENYSRMNEYVYKSGIRDLGARIDFDYSPVPTHLVKFGGEYVYHVYSPETERTSSATDINGEKKDVKNIHEVSPNLPGNEMSLYVEDDMSL